MSDSDADVQEYVMPGSENTQFFQVADPSGDAEAAADDEKFSVAGVIIVIFSIAILAAASIFYLLYVTEKRKREKREAAKLAGSSRNSMSASQSNRNSSNAANHATSAAAGESSALGRLFPCLSICINIPVSLPSFLTYHSCRQRRIAPKAN